MLSVLAAVAVLIVGGVFLARRADVRLVLALSAAALFAIAGKLPELFVKMAEEMANPKTVVPICSAVGFAYVLNLTECDKHLVHLLLRPLRAPFARALLIPGGIVTAYLVNMAVVSQTGVAAVVGPILIPLLRANGVTAITAGSLLLLGASMGGELFNPGAVEMRTLHDLTHLSTPALTARTAPVNLLACAVALLVFWRQAVRWERRHRAASPPSAPDAGTLAAEEAAPFRVNLWKACVPLIPLLLLVIAPFVRLPAEFTEHVTILVAMLVGVTAAAITAPRLAGKLSGAFFEGAGYAYTHVISLIVTATVFAEGIKANGLIEIVARSLSGQRVAAILASIALPWLLATISGSGIGPAVAVMKALLPTAELMGLNPVRMGTVTAMAAHFGRTMSPVAAVVKMCVELTATEAEPVEPLDLVRRVAPPLFAGGIVLFLFALLMR